MSSHAKLNANVREITGNQVRKLRRDDIIPAVVYSNTFKSTSVQVKKGELMKVLKLSGKTNVIDLNIDGKVQPVLIKTIDSHPYKALVRHVDFYAVDLKKEVSSVVPIVLIGESPAVKEQGAILNQQLYNLDILALPDNMPEEIEVDITSLNDFGDHIKVEDLKSGSKYKIENEADSLIISLIGQSVEVEEASVVGEEKKVESDNKIK